MCPPLLPPLPIAAVYRCLVKPAPTKAPADTLGASAAAAAHAADVMDVETSEDVDVQPSAVLRLIGLLVKEYKGEVGVQNEFTTILARVDIVGLWAAWLRQRQHVLTTALTSPHLTLSTLLPRRARPAARQRC